MYLSRLRVEVGPDPAREYPAQKWLRNLYHVHQRLCMAFPSTGHRSEGVEGDPVHIRRGPDAGFLFRVDPGRDGRPVILVQSVLQPQWECAFRNARHFLVDPGGHRDPWDVKVFDPHFVTSQHFRFRLVANPTKKVGTIQREERKSLTKEELKQRKGRHGRRVPVPSAEELSAWRGQNPQGDVREYISGKLEVWLKSRAEPGGFSVQSVTVQPGYSYFKKPHRLLDGATDDEPDGAEQGVLLRAVCFDGVLTVTDPVRFTDTLAHGIGPGKAFGFGLLSVAPSGTAL
jgi:CRISPR system Cascade subunit CasE